MYRCSLHQENSSTGCVWLSSRCHHVVMGGNALKVLLSRSHRMEPAAGYEWNVLLSGARTADCRMPVAGDSPTPTTR